MAQASLVREGGVTRGAAVPPGFTPKSPQGEPGDRLREALQRPLEAGAEAAGFPIRPWVTERWHSDPRPGEAGWSPAAAGVGRPPMNQWGGDGE
jgi:hypothetical protein